MTQIIKPKAICVFRNGNEILVSEYHDPIKNEPFYRPIGGRIEFGEDSSVALAREIKEEIDAEIDNVRFMGVLENIYHFKGKQSHELMFIYDADFIDPSFYLQSVITGFESTDERKFKIIWKPITDFIDGKLRLYPEGLIDLLIEDILASRIPDSIKTENLTQDQEELLQTILSS
jgi:8-oxo-dGTP pyrophosphatase MutT (NUDIX family)